MLFFNVESDKIFDIEYGRILETLARKTPLVKETKRSRRRTDPAALLEVTRGQILRV
jgi:hypothetical protein